MSIKISPSILSADFSILGEEIKKVEAGGADLLHIDIMDGHFVPNITMGPVVLNSFKDKTKLPMDVHLMIEHPDRYIKDFVKAGADILTVHQEACVHLNRTIQMIKAEGIKAGVAINPATPISTLEEILSDIDMVLIMTVNPGFGGQSFIDSTLDKIQRLRTIMQQRNLNIDIQVDGGINEKNISLVVEKGANIIVAGSAIFNSDNIPQTILNMRTNAGNR